jgi:DNA (cytosine-5)-methyltransferase 1
MVKSDSPSPFRFIDLFAGIGGTRLGFESVGGECVMTSEWDRFSRLTYSANFADGCSHPLIGDIRGVDPDADIPDHDLLLAGFPCQPFSIAGVSKKNSLGRDHGFLDETQGTLFFDIARILRSKRPRFFMLENVRNLLGHDAGRTFGVIRSVLEDDLGYVTSHAIVDASAWVPQRRQRLIIVGFDPDRTSRTEPFDFGPVHGSEPGPLLASVLHGPHESPEPGYTEGNPTRVSDRYTLSDHLWRYLRDYSERHRAKGNGFGFGLVGPTDRTRTLSARYHKDGSEILVDQGPGSNPRRLTPRECARLMGFTPETTAHGGDWVIPVSDTQAYRQFGNSVVVPMVRAVAEQMVAQLGLGISLTADDRRISRDV